MDDSFSVNSFLEDHFVDLTDMIAVGKIIKELGGTMPEELPAVESIKKLESNAKKSLKKQKP